MTGMPHKLVCLLIAESFHMTWGPAEGNLILYA